MSYYEPKSYACLSFLFSILNSMSFPVLGIFVSRMYFGVMHLKKDPENYYPVFRRDLILFLVFIIFSGLTAGLEKVTYGVAGENLTKNVRTELVKGIIYK